MIPNRGDGPMGLEIEKRIIPWASLYFCQAADEIFRLANTLITI